VPRSRWRPPRIYTCPQRRGNRSVEKGASMQVAAARRRQKLLCFENDPSFMGGVYPRVYPGVYPPPDPNKLRDADYLLMSSFASRRFSKGWRNVFVVSGAPLMAIVISFAAFGKSPVFDEIRASARWLIQ
jgi:hypothetical protein